MISLRVIIPLKVLVLRVIFPRTGSHPGSSRGRLFRDHALAKASSATGDSVTPGARVDSPWDDDGNSAKATSHAARNSAQAIHAAHVTMIDWELCNPTRRGPLLPEVGAARSRRANHHVRAQA